MLLSFSALQTCGPDCGKVYQKGKTSLSKLSLSPIFMINKPKCVFSFCSLQCKPEYKIAGLYVVDSIVRQSRHQFGSDKDVFGPRFTKNITGTFENLCLCPVEDRVRQESVWERFTVDCSLVTNGTNLGLNVFAPSNDKSCYCYCFSFTGFFAFSFSFVE